MTAKMNSPWLSFSGTGSAPRPSTTQGILPLGYWYRAYQSIYWRTSATLPVCNSAVDVREPSRIQARLYVRDPGWIAGPSRLMKTYARFDLTVLTIVLSGPGI